MNKTIKDPTRANSTFVGWYTDAALTTAFNTGSTLTATGTLYAKYTCNTNYTASGSTACTDQVAPTITINTQPTTTCAASKTVKATISDNIGVSTSQYAIVSSTSACSSSTTSWTNYTSASDITLNSEDYNNKYVCFKATDAA